MILFIDAACKVESRTRKLALSFTHELGEQVVEKNLYDMSVPLLDARAIAEREIAACNQDESNPFVALATEFKNADKIVICAPHWDMAYPAVLRSYIEAIMVQGITFSIGQYGEYEGHCKATNLYYFTTSGGHIKKPDLGFAHISCVAKEMLGIKETKYYSLEGLDIQGADVERMLDDKISEIRGSLGNISNVNIEFPRTFGRTIMIVDDSHVNIFKAEAVLKESGYTTISAISGKECLKKLKLNKPDLILLDVKMPEMDGFETLDNIKSNPETRNIPVVFVTAENSVDNVIEASKHDVAGYVTKPFSKEELLNHVKRVLGKVKS